jgi:archaeosine-15-forming tRNA-guanine transglycosylase
MSHFFFPDKKTSLVTINLDQIRYVTHDKDGALTVLFAKDDFFTFTGEDARRLEALLELKAEADRNQAAVA